MANEQQKTEKSFEVAKQLNSSVFKVIGADNLMGFEKAYLIANAAGELKTLLNDEYMRPIMELQGNKLGFKTDKDQNGGYPKEVVKNCLIEAVLTGVQPFGNQFNIIAGNCYITKEGFGYLLQNFKGLQYELIPMLPRINQDKTSAAIVMKIKWTLNGETKEREIEFPIKMNSFMGTDAVIGKATRKARAWLFNTISGTEITDGDVTDTEATVVGTKINGETYVVIEDLQLLFDNKKSALTEDELKNAQRIIDSKEEKSYNKLYKVLQSK
jgi:hypothetical protein